MDTSTGLRLRPLRTKPDHGKLHDSVHGIPQDADEIEPMTPAGRVFSDPLFNCHILVIFGFRNPCQIEAIKEGLRNTLLKHKRFCSVVREGVKGELCWVRTTVNLDDHIIIPAIKEEDKNSANFVEDYASKLAQAPPLDIRKPLFELHFLDAKLDEAVANVVFRVHHALGDGTSLMSLLLACTRRVDQPDSLPSIPSQPRKISRTDQKDTTSITLHWQKIVLQIWRLILIFWYTLLDVCNFIATSFWMDDSQSPIKGFPGVENSAKRLAHSTVSIEDIRVVKRAVQGTVNDVMFGMLAAGLSRYLQNQYAGNDSFSAEGETERDKRVNPGFKMDVLNQKKRSMPDLRVRASALINTRPSPGLHEMQDMMHGGSQARWGNQMGYILLPVPISEHGDLMEYVHRAKSISDKKKLSLEAPFTYNSGTLLMNLAGAKIATKLTYRCASHATLSFSNVVGPSEEIQFFGNPITHIIPTVSGQPQSLCVHIQSYMGKVTIIAFAVKDIIPDPKQLCNYMASAPLPLSPAPDPPCCL